jgi:hypothetical protein
MKMVKINKKLFLLSVLFCSLIFSMTVHPSFFSLHIITNSSEMLDDDELINGNFEDESHFPGWDLKYIDPGYVNLYNASSVRSFSGSYSYYMYGEANNPNGRGARNEVSQNLSISNPLNTNLTGHIFVEQCDSANTYASWVGIYLEFYNSSYLSLGRIYYQFASDNQGSDFQNEINLYNQLGTWLDLNRNVTNDFETLIGSNFDEIIQLEIVMNIVASDGTQAGNRGYAEAYFDDLSLNLDTIVVNGDFEDLLMPIGWDLTYIDYGASNIYNISTIRSYNGPTSLYLFGQAQNPGPRGARNEVSQRIFLSDFSYIVLIGAVYVEQCDSANTYTSWAGIIIEFFDNNRTNLGIIYYQFAMDNQFTEFMHEINLYNQLGEWLEFNRNIAEDYNDLIGTNSDDVVELKLSMYTITSDGTQAGNTGYTEAYFDNFLLYQIGLSTTLETTTETVTDTTTETIVETTTEIYSSVYTTTEVTTITLDPSTKTVTTTKVVTTTISQVTTTTSALSIAIIMISILSIVTYRAKKK